MKNLFIERLKANHPVNIAHRGARHHAPENTLAAFETAAAHGAEAIEFDIRLCKPGRWVVIHDFRLNRTTNGRGYVRTKTIDHIRTLQAGVASHPGLQQRIPTLSEVLELARDRLLLNIEIKAVSPVADRHLFHLLELLYEHETVHRCLISSFNPVVLRRLAQIAPELPTGLLLTGRLLSQRERTPLRLAPDANSLHVHARVVNQRLVDRVSRTGLYLLAWGANTPEMITKLIALGIHGIITDEPKLLNELLENESQR